MIFSIYTSIIAEGKRDLLLLIFFLSFCYFSLYFFTYFSLHTRQLIFHWLCRSFYRATNRDHSNYPFRSTTRTMMLSEREIYRQREGEKEKREVLIRTLINLFCSDPEC